MYMYLFHNNIDGYASTALVKYVGGIIINKKIYNGSFTLVSQLKIKIKSRNGVQHQKNWRENISLLFAIWNETKHKTHGKRPTTLL